MYVDLLAVHLRHHENYGHGLSEYGEYEPEQNNIIFSTSFCFAFC